MANLNISKHCAVIAAVLGLSCTCGQAAPLTRQGLLPSPAYTLAAGPSASSDKDEKAETKAPSKRQLTTRQKRERAALEQRRLLQEKATTTRIERNQRNLDTVRDDQAERLRLQQQTQRLETYQQRQLAQPQQPGQAPRLTPLGPSLYDQTHPRCGVPGMPLC